uniref:NADH-ubiquinone oxidoreductase chain 4L n=1 Tax=Prionospio sp. 7 MH-2023 TaxID=3059275 RepID=A0AAU6QFX9_9ANNE
MLINLPLTLMFISALALCAFISQRQHVLMCLLSLEATVLSLAFALTILAAPLQNADLFYCIVILSFGACEAALALAVLVIVTRSFGSDLINSINLNKC